MSVTPNFGWPLLATNQASPEVTHNAAVIDIDAALYAVASGSAGIPNASGSKATTTGSISVGTNQLTVASATGWLVGMGIAVANAGAGGTTELITHITAIAGAVFTLNDNALATATTQTVNHDDTAAIAAAIATGGPVRFAKGDFNVTSEFTLSSPVKIEGAGPGATILWLRNAALAHGVFRLDYQMASVTPTTTGKGCIVRDLEISAGAGITMTGGYGIYVASASGTGFYTTGVHIENVHINNLYGGLFVGSEQLQNWFRDISINTTVAYGIYYDCPIPGGDDHFENIELIGFNTGLYIVHSDTAEYSNLKINQSQITFAAPSSAGDITRVRFINPSIENAPTQSVDFGTHGCTQVQFVGGTMSNATLTNLANAVGLQMTGLNLGNTNTSKVIGVGTFVNVQTGTNYTANVYDDGQIVRMANGSASTFTVPMSVFPVGAFLTVVQYGAGQITLTPAGGVTINTPSSLTTRAQYSTVSLYQVDTDIWIAAGDLT